MAKVSDVLISLYKIALPFCERRKIALNLDLADPSLTVDISERILKYELRTYIQNSFSRTKQGAITIGSKSGQKDVLIFIKDTGSAIPKSQRTAMEANPHVQVHSRHGYGTTITLKYPKTI